MSEKPISKGPTPPDGGYGWVVVMATFLVNMTVDGVIFTCGAILLPVWATRFGGQAMASLVFSLMTGCYYFCGPLVASLVNVFGVRPIAISGSLLSTSGFLLCSLTNNQWLTYIFFGIFGGIGFGCMYVSSIIAVTTYFTTKRSLATGIAVCGSGIGTVVFSQLNTPVYGVLKEDSSLFLVYLAVISLLGAGFSLFFAPLTTTSKGWWKKVFRKAKDDRKKLSSAEPDAFYEQNISMSKVTSNKTAIAVPVLIQQSKLTLIKESLCSIIDKNLLLSPSFLTLAISGIFTVMAFYVPFVYIRATMPDTIPEQSKSLIVTLIGAFNIAFRVLCGIVSDHPRMSALQVSNFASVLAGASMILVPWCTQLWHYALFTIPFSAGVACFAALRSVICVDLVGVEKLSNAFGILIFFMGIGAVLGPPVAGMLKDLTKSYDLAFYVMGGVFVISGLMTVPLAKLKSWEESRKLVRQELEVKSQI